MPYLLQVKFGFVVDGAVALVDRSQRIRAQRTACASTLPDTIFVATMRSGAAPFSTQLSITEFQSTRSGPAPPPQCATPGSMNSRA